MIFGEMKMYKIPLQAACVFVFDGDGNVLTVTRRDTNILSLPGGKVDSGETHLQAAIRECSEETGVILKPELMIPIYSEVVVGDDNMDYYCTAFVYNAKCSHYEANSSWVLEPGIYAKFTDIASLLYGGAFKDFNHNAFRCITDLVYEEST